MATDRLIAKQKEKEGERDILDITNGDSTSSDNSYNNNNSTNDNNNNNSLD